VNFNLPKSTVHCQIQTKQKFELFLSLSDSEWSHEISTHALRSLHQRKFNKPLVLPLAEDVKTMHNHLDEKARECVEALACTPTSSLWSKLCQVTLTQVVLFNRRRGGEAERVLLSVYNDSDVENANEDVQKCLSKVERALCKEFRILYTEGKRGRKVPILLINFFTLHNIRASRCRHVLTSSCIAFFPTILCVCNKLCFCFILQRACCA